MGGSPGRAGRREIGPGELDRILGEALVRFDPEEAEHRRLAAKESRFVDIHLDTLTDGAVCTGTVHGSLDAADALDLDLTLSEMAAELRDLGCPDSLGARRAHALGQLARGEQPLDYAGRYGAGEGAATSDEDRSDPAGAEETSQPDRGPRPRRPRTIVLHVRLCEASLRGLGDGIGTLATDPGRVLGQVTREQVQDWCTRPAMNADLDHITPWQDDGEGGKTHSHGLAPLCGLHHRAKTHGSWTYTRVEAGEYVWTSPQRLRFHVDGSGTTDITRAADPERQPCRS